MTNATPILLASLHPTAIQQVHDVRNAATWDDLLLCSGPRRSEAVLAVVVERCMRFAYADPPYMGQAARHYRDGGTARRKVAGNPEASEVDHAHLIAQLVDGYPDGWALSASSPSLRLILPSCPEGARVAAWVKPFAVFKPNVNPAYAWEPVIFYGGRKRGRDDETVRDWHSERVTLQKGLVGAKPMEFCRWVLRLLGFDQGDTLDDLFPGSGAMGAAVRLYTAQTRIAGIA